MNEICPQCNPAPTNLAEALLPVREALEMACGSAEKPPDFDYTEWLEEERSLLRALAAKALVALAAYQPTGELREALQWIADRADSGGRRMETAMTACEEIEKAARSALAAPAPEKGGVTSSEIADAIERCDWSNVSIGNKEILKAAIAALRLRSQSGRAGVITDEMLAAATKAIRDSQYVARSLAADLAHAALTAALKGEK